MWGGQLVSLLESKGASIFYWFVWALGSGTNDETLQMEQGVDQVLQSVQCINMIVAEREFAQLPKTPQPARRLIVKGVIVIEMEHEQCRGQRRNVPSRKRHLFETEMGEEAKWRKRGCGIGTGHEGIRRPAGKEGCVEQGLIKKETLKRLDAKQNLAEGSRMDITAP